METETSKTITTQNIFLHLPTPPPTTGESPTLVFFITGNPGLISYYHEFLNLLCCQQQQQQRQQQQQPSISAENHATGPDPPGPETPIPTKYIIAGFSLGGFDLPATSPPTQVGGKSSTQQHGLGTARSEVGESQALDDFDFNLDFDGLLYPPGFVRKDIYSLRDQIELCYVRIKVLVERVMMTREDGVSVSDGNGSSGTKTRTTRPTGKGVKVILMGHSVGAYIAMELVRIHHHHCQVTINSTLSSEKEEEEEEEEEESSARRHPRFRIDQVILLTPTILNISQSSSGRLATPLLSSLPFLPALAQLGSTGLSGVLSTPWLRWMVSKVTGMSEESDALAATVAFVKSCGAVKQALCLARDEMKEIGANKWGEEIWGVVRESGDGSGEGWVAPRLRFWFAKEDHWVADVTREEIVRIVGGKVQGGLQSGAEVVVDEDGGLVHAWCIQQSEMVARRVRMWLEDGLAKDKIIV